ncbi:hypothetical protein IWX78_000178 [Mycetocola sp. CAN_C7]|uniref:DUF937 domain-containing protein n=1 Tax=Mycetocola sp. CAN_C7 TaxID=2787724 RepID=UPI0018CA0FC5
MASLDELMRQIPIGDVALRLGVDESTARAAVEQALPALVSGLEANASDPSGAASIEKAVSKHSPALVDGGVRLDEVDTDDGDRIVSHIFGPNREQVVATLGARSATEDPASQGSALSGIVAKVLPILAPIVLSYLAKQFLERKQSVETAQPTEPMQPKTPPTEPRGGGLGDLLGGLLGGGSTGAADSSGESAASGGIRDILGGLLGGGSAGGGVGDLLGGLLGAGRR